MFRPKPVKDIGDYYENCRKESEYWLTVLERSRKIGCSEETIRRIERRLEIARNTGD